MSYDTSIKSEDFLQIFEKIVFPLVSNYHPSFIIMTHSFTFSRTINFENNISLNVETFFIIINKLSNLCNKKMILIPMINVREDNEEIVGNHYQGQLQKVREIKIPEILFERYKKYFSYKNLFSFQTNANLYDNRIYIYQLLSSFIYAVTGNFNKNNLKLFFIIFSHNTESFQHLINYANNFLRVINARNSQKGLCQSKKFLFYI